MKQLQLHRSKIVMEAQRQEITVIERSARQGLARLMTVGKEELRHRIKRTFEEEELRWVLSDMERIDRQRVASLPHARREPSALLRDLQKEQQSVQRLMASLAFEDQKQRTARKSPAADVGQRHRSPRGGVAPEEHRKLS
jgi:hypothetical protein